MVEVHFYGQLKRFGQDPRPGVESYVRLSAQDVPTVAALLQRLGIGSEEVGHVFLNRRLLVTCSPMALWLQYPEAAERRPACGTTWDTTLRPGDRVALFGQDMSLLVV